MDNITQKQLGYISYNVLREHKDDFPEAFETKNGQRADLRLREAEKWCKDNLDRWEAGNVIDLVQDGHFAKAFQLLVQFGLPTKE